MYTCWICKLKVYDIQQRFYIIKKMKPKFCNTREQVTTFSDFQFGILNWTNAFQNKNSEFQMGIKYFKTTFSSIII